jgi:hypothetical protein
MPEWPEISFIKPMTQALITLDIPTFIPMGRFMGAAIREVRRSPVIST